MSNKNPKREFGTGRQPRRNADETRKRILAAAQRMFSTRDYGQARISDIAREAEANVALVTRYFGSKEKLFEAALTDAIGVVANLDITQFGRQSIEMLIASEGTTTEPLPMILHGVSDTNAQPIALELVKSRAIGGLGAWFGPPDGERRAADALALFFGFFTLRRLLPLRQFTGEMDRETRDWLVGSLQAIADGSGRARDHARNLAAGLDDGTPD